MRLQLQQIRLLVLVPFFLFGVLACGGSKELPRKGVEVEEAFTADSSGSQKKPQKRKPGKKPVVHKPEPSPARFRRPLKIATMNIKWFGLGGNLHNRPEDEDRFQSLQNFFTQHYSDVDVFFFQEIVFVGQLQAVLPNYKCHSYRHNGRKHQFVAVCVKPPLKFKRSPFDKNYKLEDVALGSRGLRPALHGLVVEPKVGAYLYVVGLHLKAGMTKSSVRRRQINALIRSLKLVKKVPLVIAGDMNTFKNRRSQGHESEAFHRWFQTAGLKLKHATSHRPATSMGRHSASLDHIWFDEKLSVVESAEVFEVCAKKYRYFTRKSYRRQISDHCPVTIKLQY